MKARDVKPGMKVRTNHGILTVVLSNMITKKIWRIYFEEHVTMYFTPGTEVEVI